MSGSAPLYIASLTLPKLRIGISNSFLSEIDFAHWISHIRNPLLMSKDWRRITRKGFRVIRGIRGQLFVNLVLNVLRGLRVSVVSVFGFGWYRLILRFQEIGDQADTPPVLKPVAINDGG